MLLDENAIDLLTWKEDLEKGNEADLDKFITQMIEMNLSNSVFVDNTASPIPPRFYEKILKSSISIVACNKIANSGPYSDYELLKKTSRDHGVDFLYETNVGAGLPIVRTLKDLMTSGDRLLKIEAILSGTISFIFNNFIGDQNFHDVVRKVHELGFTEPDPRDDLSGKDFLRKMLILARDAGYQVEESDVDLAPILPETSIRAKSVEEFYNSLKLENQYFEKIKNEAFTQGKALRYIAKLEKGKVSIQLEQVDENHPFFSLSGSDNIISFTTERYKDRPLVVKGPGAGQEVTAAGVFADLVNTGRR